MARLIHEIWQVLGDDGEALPTLCLAGPDGNGIRAMLHEEAVEHGRGVPQCVGRFEAESHFEAMTIYYRRLGWGEYRTEFDQDREPYPDYWARRQST